MNDNTIRMGMKVQIGDSTLIGRTDCICYDDTWLVTDIGGDCKANGHFPENMLRPVFRIGLWAGVKANAQRGIITGIAMGEIWLRDPDDNHRFSISMADAELVDPATPDNAPPAPDLGQRIKTVEEWAKEWGDLANRLAALETGLTKESTIFDVWRRAHMNMQDRALAAIKERLDVLKANPTPEPERPLGVGDEVWVKGTLIEKDHTGRPYRVDFGHDDLFWLCKDIAIKRA